MQKIRIDVLLIELGLAQNRDEAQKMVMAGQVRVGGQRVVKPDMVYERDAAVEVEMGPRYVSRGGEKLEPALAAFNLHDLRGRICADLGASTGGFTDCLLQHGAARVYAVDVGYGVLHWKLRNDPRVVVMERTNARHLRGFPEPVVLTTIDASFISLEAILPGVKGWLAPEGEVVALIKPQFEAGRAEVSRGEGVVQDPKVHRQVLDKIVAFAQMQGFTVCGLIRSPLRGPKGNIEFLIHLSNSIRSPQHDEPLAIFQWIDAALGR